MVESILVYVICPRHGKVCFNMLILGHLHSCWGMRWIPSMGLAWLQVRVYKLSAESVLHKFAICSLSLNYKYIQNEEEPPNWCSFIHLYSLVCIILIGYLLFTGSSSHKFLASQILIPHSSGHWGITSLMGKDKHGKRSLQSSMTLV